MEISCSWLAEGDKNNKRVEWFYVQSRLFCELLVCWQCNSESESHSESDSELSQEEGGVCERIYGIEMEYDFQWIDLIH